MIEIRAKIYLFKHGELTKNEVLDKYRPAFKFEDNEVYFSGSLQLNGELEKVQSGEQELVTIYFDKNAATLDSIKEGTTFGIYEPPIKFGEGEVLSVIFD